jgi:hypothetical protein
LTGIYSSQNPDAHLSVFDLPIRQLLIQDMMRRARHLDTDQEFSGVKVQDGFERSGRSLAQS